ncbi:N-6 DNA methylase [Streptomyces sp. NPDC056831]|uniref:N-6 DNA methylase n=1 Tax=Streptomyces sp. NPDC056831 TaxID=3345954 RepID=UPI0036A375DA
MAMVTSARLQRHLFEALDSLRGRGTARECLPYLLAVLLLKHAGDESSTCGTGAFAVPPEARWERLRDEPSCNLDDQLDRAWTAFARANAPLTHTLEVLSFRYFLRRNGSPVRDAADRWRRLVDHFDKLSLSNADLLTPGVLGAASDALIAEAGASEGKAGGEFFTPRPLVQLMAELARPRPGERVYDPCVGTGGTLLAARTHAREHAGEGAQLHLAGQDANAISFTLAALNLALHGAAQDSELALGDVLTAPAHRPRSEVDRFDVVLAVPPFAINYDRASLPDLPARMPYGLPPESRKADLVFVQHMLWMARRSSGRVVALIPHGALFRGGGERAVRHALLDPETDAVEAVIGLAPNLLYSTGIPVALLVLRSPGTKPPERRGKVLFINADRAYEVGRALNVLRECDVHRIARAFHGFADEPGFSRVVAREELAETDDSLSVRRYVDSTPPPEPQDVRAHMEGGMPRAELESRTSLLASYGLSPGDLFAARAHGDPAYLEFLPQGHRPDADQLTGLARPAEEALWKAFDAWWPGAVARLVAAPGAEPLGRMRADLSVTFTDTLEPSGPLNRDELLAVFDTWWAATRRDLEVLARRGCGALLDAWVAEVNPAPEPAPPRKATRTGVYHHDVVETLCPGFLARWRAALLRVDDAHAAYQAVRPHRTGESQQDVDPDQLEHQDDSTAAVLRELKAQLRSARRGLSEVEAGLNLAATRAALGAIGEREAVERVLRRRLSAVTEADTGRKRTALLDAYRRWEAKYELSFREIEAQLGDRKDSAAAALTRQNPWSRQAEEDIPAVLAAAPERLHTRQQLRRVIDVEKAVEASLAKLDIDVRLGFLLPERAVRVSVPLRDIIARADTAAIGQLGADNQGQPVIRPANLTATGLDLTDLRYAARRATQVLRAGDVLVPQFLPASPAARDSPWWAVAWRDELPGATFSAGLMRLVPDTAQVLAGYLADWLCQPAAQEQLRAIASELMDVRMLGRRLLDLEIDLPTPAEQRRIVEASAVTKRRAVRKRAELAKLRLIREALMGDLETGRPSVTHLD